MVAKHRIFQKAVSLLAAASLLISGTGTAAAGEPAEPGEKPQLRVVGTLTDGGRYLELGLSVDSRNGTFQSAGVLLKYDSSKLTPLRWGTIEDAPEALEAAKVAVPTAAEADSAWRGAAILPTKSRGADDLTGKTAMAVSLPGAADAAYLYLSAEAPKGQKLAQALPAESGTAPEGVADATANGKPVTAVGAAESPADQAVTVRFLVGTTTGPEPDAAVRGYTLAELAAAVDIVVCDTAAETPNAAELALLRASPLALPGGAPVSLEGSSYIADNADYTTAGVTNTADVTFTWIAAGQTVDSGGGSGSADVSKIRTVTFYDWDGTTKLGVVAVQAGEILGVDAYQTFLTGLYDTSVMALGQNADDPYELAPIASEGYLFNPERETKPLLTDKGGYTFIGWVPLGAEASHYAKADEAAARSALFDWDRQKTQADADLGAGDPYPDFAVGDYVTPIAENIDVKACYLANSRCGNSGTTAQRYYTIEYDTIERTGTSYTIRVKISRYYSSLQNVFPARAQEPILRVDVQQDKNIGDTVSFSVQLQNRDVTTALFTFPASCYRAALNVSDIAGKNGVVNSAVSYSRSVDLCNVDFNNRQNMIKMGTVYLLNENARKTANTVKDRITGFTSASYFNTDLGIISSGTAIEKSGKLLTAWRAANEWTATAGPDGNGILDARDCVQLTYGQVDAILNNKPNVYLKNVSFTDSDSRGEYIGGALIWDQVTIIDSTVETPESISDIKVYWSRDGITKGAEITSLLNQNGIYTIPSGTVKQYYNRYLMICAVDAMGNELPASAVIPIKDNVAD